MTINQVLNWTIEKLKKSKIVSPVLDAEIILAFTIKKTKEFLFAYPEKKLTSRQFENFKKLIARRTKHEPIAYIVGRKEFYGLDFFVNKNVLIPRPETEILVEAAINKNPTTIIDVGTGSGAIAISIAHHLPGTKIFATEISPDALAVARKNARRHKTTVTFIRGNLLNPIINYLENCKLKIKNLTIAANLPYLTTQQWHHTQPEIKKYEPRQALDGGPDGLKYYHKLLDQTKKIVKSYKLQAVCLFEIDPSQTKPLLKLILASFPLAKIEIKKDLAGRDRLVIFEI